MTVQVSPFNLSARDILLVVLVVFIWGLGFAPTKYALNDFTPFQLGAARFLLAAFPLILFVSRPKIPLKWFFLYGLTQGVGQFGFMFFAMSIGMTSGLASVLMQMQIFFTAIFGATLLGEVFPRSLRIGMGIAGTGLIFFAVNVYTVQGFSEVTAGGFVLTLIAASMWACSNIVVKKLQLSGLEYKPLGLVVWSSLVAGIVFVLISVAVDDASVRMNWLEASVGSWLSVLYLGWVASCLAYMLWTTLLNRHPASQVAPYSIGIPVIGLLAGCLLLQEPITVLEWIGSLLIISALFFVVKSTLQEVNKRMEGL